jgi:hypothetical protein
MAPRENFAFARNAEPHHSNNGYSFHQIQPLSRGGTDMAKSMNNAPAAAQQKVVDYINAITAVTAWATQITQCQLPPLMQPPPGYADFADELVGAKGDAINWTQSILFQSSQIPAGLTAYNGAVQSYNTALTTALTTLSTDPNNSAAQTSVRNALQSLSGAFGSSLGALSSLTTSLQTFSKGVAADSKTLEGFAAVAASAEGADAASVAQLTTVIAEFQKSIANQNQMLTLEKWASWDMNIFLAAASVGVGLIFSPEAVAVGAIVGIIFGVVTVTGTSFLKIGPGELVDPDALEALQTAVTDTNAEVGQLNSQIAVVQAIATTFATIAAEDSNVAQSVVTAINLWNSLQAMLTTAFDGITAAQSAQTSKNWPGVQQQATAALAAWAQAQTLCGALQGITYNIAPQPQTAPLPA